MQRRMVILVALLLLTGCGRTAQRIFSPPPQVTRLTPETVTIPAGRFWEVAFASPRGDAMVTGHFVALGGSGNDISAYVRADDDFVNFENGHEFRAYFQSRKTSAATIRVGPLPAGAYHLVFDNRFSLFSKKSVVATVQERFTPAQ